MQVKAEAEDLFIYEHREAFSMYFSLFFPFSLWSVLVRCNTQEGRKRQSH